MILSSLGFHTFTMFVRLFSWLQADELLKCFKQYSKNTGGMIIYKTGKNDSDYRIEFTGEDKGISWLIKFDNRSHGYKYYAIEATINPKTLAGIKDYITASNETCLENLQPRYNALVQSISDKIPLFADYMVNRLDYCVNFRLLERHYCCTADKMIHLIKQGDIPKYYTEYQEYSSSGHRMKSPNYSFYLKSKSVNINCYWKYSEWLKNHPDREGIEDSKEVIRFEIQYKYKKIYPMRVLMKKNAILSESLNSQITTHLLSDVKASEVVLSYFSKIIKFGNYHTLKNAKIEVKDKKYGFYRSTVELLTKVLELVNTHRGIHNAKKHLEKAGIEKNDFNRALRILAQIDINPITIPKDWDTPFIPSLLHLLGEVDE